MLNDDFSCEKACEMLKNNTAQLVDVRSTEEFSQGALPNAINLPLQSIMAADNLLDKNKSIILYCVSGARSNTAKNYLIQMGFKDVYDLGSYQKYCC
ncbi:Phage shock protein E [hydrothermal vent metagenome]|uniref:Phage shock protein E n=1 Tax=hydrothermal vent metagenome TaxID=652676 RepID=A0A1W1CHM7_9ZZZZ